MIYKNYTDEAIMELEYQRTGEYGANEAGENSCDSGCLCDVLYRTEDGVLCEDCLIEDVRSELSDLDEKWEKETPAKKIIRDIFSDFSDSEILTYIENRYEKI